MTEKLLVIKALQVFKYNVQKKRVIQILKTKRRNGKPQVRIFFYNNE